ncbi:ATP-dependent nuclease [Candidatus Thiothrix anitrata]|uniref:AAA family ATPase n=1 Tax=Candidatus Thiothrix anitrata TaxID=2823902 RepID=A0ABX7X625_9GAMM|nr:AAA family ATPase [Candidatus Thiothrix anitrata]QTR48570.1 AAA family ATPase [Candidatus Thiothrix anitrata]
MHISKLTVVNYRNFANTTLTFNKGVNTVIGENGSGKTNIFRAIRLLLDDNMVKSAFKLDDSDFHRGLNDWRGHWIIISLEFDEIGSDEAIQALFLHATGVLENETINKATYNLIFRPNKNVRLKLASLEDGDLQQLTTIRQKIEIDDYETVFTGRSDGNFGHEATYKEIVGDFDQCIFSKEVDDPRIGSRVPTILSLAREVSFTYIQALRDVVAEFHNNRTNPLLALLKSKSGDISEATMTPIVEKVQALNASIESLEDVQTVRKNIRSTINNTAGETYSPKSLSIKSDLPEDADKLFQSLRLFVGESDDGYEGAIHELSLGGANLIFLTLKLLQFKYQIEKKQIANFLLIEEPEAHIHTHIQKTLFDRIDYQDTQIIYSTHSTHISEVSNIENVNILGRRDNKCEAYQPSTGLKPDEIGNIQRYLDAIRSNLLFAKSVVLVEGDAEEILIPILFKKVFGISLDELGVSLINIRSTGFKNIAVLFHDTRIRKRCSIITDLDAAFIDTTHTNGESDADKKYKNKCINAATVGAARKDELDTFSHNNPWISVHYAQHTFEVDFITTGNSENIAALVPQIYIQESTINTAKTEIRSGNIAQYGKRVLTMAENQGKGWFAILLGKTVDHKTKIPCYIRDAIFFSQPNLSTELFFNIYLYRLNCALDCGCIPHALSDNALVSLHEYRAGRINLSALKKSMQTYLQNDQIHTLLASVE